MAFLIFTYTGLHWWFTIFASSTFVAKVYLDVIGSFRVRYLTEQMYRQRCSRVLSIWLGINLPVAIYFGSQVMLFRYGR